MASFSKGTSFTDGVTGDVTAAKLHALVDSATPVAGLILDRTNETVIGTDDVIMISDTSESGALNKMTVENLFKAPLTGTINSTAGTITAATIPTLTAGTTTGTASTFTSGTITTLNSTTGTITTGVIPTLTAGTTTSTAATITTGTIPTLVATTLITSGTGTFAAPAIVPTGDTNTGIFFPAADTIAFSEGGTESMRIDSSGNVGIGTTSPSYRLHVNQNVNSNSVNTQAFFQDSGSTGGTNYQHRISVTGKSGAAKIDIGTTDSSTNHFNNLACGFIAGDTLPLNIGTISSNPLILSTNVTERLRIDSSGNVGIGTTAPSASLHISKSGDAFPSSSNPRILLSETASGRFGLIEFDSSTNLNIWGSDAGSGSIRFFNRTGGGTERLRIDSSGNVGIGTTGAVNKLEIVGSFGRGAPITKTGDFTLADTENWLIVNKGSSCTVTLPAASSWTGREFTIKVITAHTVVSASSNVVPRNSATAGTAILAATAGSWATLVSNGTNWVIMCGS